MKAIKNINNNVVLCVDSGGTEVIAFGKGIGFSKPPYEIPLSKIERTFYDLKEVDFDLIKEIPSNVFKASVRIVDNLERFMDIKLISSAVLALSDHINFAIQRKEQQIELNLTMHEDIKHLYPNELKYAYYALDIIEEETGVRLDNTEAGTIALHFINNQIQTGSSLNVINKLLIEDSLKIISDQYNVEIERGSFNFSRYVTHMEYLLQRSLKNDQIDSNNIQMFNTLVSKYPEALECARKISILFKERLDIELNDEEMMYLMLHINRLCTREITR